MLEDQPESVHLYRCEITLWEHMFFSSREISSFFQTEPLIGNYALAYALGLARSSYHVEADANGRQKVSYKEDLLPLNERGVYVTPATIVGAPCFSLSHFNAQADAYWYAFTQNAIVVKRDDQEAEYDGQNWYVLTPAAGRRSKARPANFPQHGKIKMLALGNRAVAYLLAREPIEVVRPGYRLPHYIRLGKWMSKAAVDVSQQQCDPIWQEEVSIEGFLNPADLPDPSALRVFDLVSIHPVPLIRNARMRGWFYRTPDGAWLPARMRFGVDRLQGGGMAESDRPSRRRRGRRSSPDIEGKKQC
jgi:CRISPR-associated protein Csc1